MHDKVGHGCAVALVVIGIILVIAALLWYAFQPIDSQQWTNGMSWLIAIGVILIIIGIIVYCCCCTGSKGSWDRRSSRMSMRKE